MTTPRKSNPFRKTNVAVPVEVQTAILALGTGKRARELLGIGQFTYEEAIAPNGRVSSDLLAKIQTALAKITAQDARV